MTRASSAVLAALLVVGLAAPLAAQPGDAAFDQLYQAGIDAYHLGDHRRARTLFEKARALHPELPGPHRQLAAVAFAQGRFADCVAAARKAVEVKPVSELSQQVRSLHEECRQALRRAPLRAALEPDQGALAVTSSVDEAIVVVDGLTVGPTPLEPRPVAARALEVEVRGVGHLPARARASVVAGLVTDLHVVLERDPAYRAPAAVTAERPSGRGWLRLTTGVPARVRIDGREVQPDRRGWVRLGAGVHEASVEAPAHDRWKRRVRVPEGQLVELEVPLVPTEVNRRRRLIGWSAAGLGVAAAAVGFGLSLAELRAYEEAQDLHDREVQRPDNVPIDQTDDLEPIGTRQQIDDLRDRGSRLGLWAAISYGAAAAALGTSVYYFVRARSSERAGSPPPFALAPAAGEGVGLALVREVRW